MTGRWLRILPLLLLLAAITLSLGTCAPKRGLKAQLRSLGTLRVAMINSATTYYRRGHETAGFAYDLVQRFAQNLGVDVKIIPVANRHEALAAVARGRAHLAAGLATGPAQHEHIRFTPAYARVDLNVVYNTNTPRPDTLTALDARLSVQAHGVLGHKLQRRHPQLSFTRVSRTNAEALMAQVAQGRRYSTIASADLVAINQRYHPELRVAFTLPHIRRRLAWALPAHYSDDLYQRAVQWLAHAQKTGFVRILRRRYFAHAQRLGFVGGRIFAHQVHKRLPRWRGLFKRAAQQYGLDWRLLAAMSYQESHWKPRATSPTGVRGLMMLTQATAAGLGVSNRLDPQQSVDGGARYLLLQRQRLPASIDNPDRTWMALAAYNIGYGHLMDARRLLQARGRDADLWINVREALTWLTQRSYLDATRYGYAPGYQAIEYVGNIRAYYDILKWMSGNHTGDKPEALTHESHRPDPKPPRITIKSPAL